LTATDKTGAAVFWTDPGGEIRFYIRGSLELGYTLSSAERTLPEQFELLGVSMTVIERHLFGVFAPGVRSRNSLPRLTYPRSPDELAAGYLLGDSDSEGYRWLSNPDGLVAKAQGKIGSVSTLTKLSHLLSNPLADVQASLEDPDGRPLFRVRAR
jgi:Immunity protein 61